MRSIFSGELATGTASQRSPPAVVASVAWGAGRVDVTQAAAVSARTATTRRRTVGRRVIGPSSAELLSWAAPASAQGFKCACRGQPIGGGIPSLGCDQSGGATRRPARPAAAGSAAGARPAARAAGRGGPAAGPARPPRRCGCPAPPGRAPRRCRRGRRRDRPNCNIMRSGGLAALPSYGRAASRRAEAVHQPRLVQLVAAHVRAAGQPGGRSGRSRRARPAPSEAGSQPTLGPPPTARPPGSPLRAARSARHGQLTGPPHA